ncbi:MAG TPA: HesB/YadR/YfhF-family protein [Actinomycetes bacterium]|nr:HesB/YadR/YfhF-family protein [Actinomycetes bacterium]
MLTITSEAAQVIGSIVASSPIPQGGVKISAKPVSDTESRLELSIVEGPTETDSVIEEEGTRVFLEDAVSDYLEDKVLDAQMQEGEVRFTIQEQGPQQPQS